MCVVIGLQKKERIKFVSQIHGYKPGKFSIRIIKKDWITEKDKTDERAANCSFGEEKKNIAKYSQTATNGNLSTTASFFWPQGGLCGEVRLYNKCLWFFLPNMLNHNNLLQQLTNKMLPCIL